MVFVQSKFCFGLVSDSLFDFFCILKCPLYHTAYVLWLSRIQTRLSSWFGEHRRKTPTPWSTGFNSNISGSHVYLFHCVTCDVFLSFGPSTTLMSLVWKMSSLWVFVIMTELCTFLLTTTLMKTYTSPMTSKLLGVHYNTRPMQSLMPFFKKTQTLVHLWTKCSTCGRGTIIWELGGCTSTNIMHWNNISLLTKLSWIQEITRPSFLMPWMTSTGELGNLNYSVPHFWYIVVFFIYLFTYSFFVQVHGAWSC